MLHAKTHKLLSTHNTHTFHMRTATMSAPSSSSTRPKLSGATSSAPTGAGTSASSMRSSSRSCFVSVRGSGFGSCCRSSKATTGWVLLPVPLLLPLYQEDRGRTSDFTPAPETSGLFRHCMGHGIERHARPMLCACSAVKDCENCRYQVRWVERSAALTI